MIIDYIFYGYGLIQVIAITWDFLISKKYKEIAGLNTSISKTDHKKSINTVKKLGPLKIINSFIAIGWPYVGLIWFPEFGLFLTLVIIGACSTILLFLAKTPEAKIGVTIFRGISDIILISIILYLHFSPIFFPVP